MQRDETRRVIEQHVSGLGPALYAGIAYGVQDAFTRAQGLKHAKYPHLRPLITRATLREYLETEGLPDPWSVTGNPALMGQLLITSAPMNLTLRVLKERRRSYPQSIPVAGHSKARRKAWQAPLFDISPSSPNSTELLLLWDYAEQADEGFTLRVVHPVEAGVYGQAVRCDLDFTVKPGGTLFENRQFTGDEEEIDFFQAHIERAENDDIN